MEKGVQRFRCSLEHEGDLQLNTLTSSWLTLMGIFYGNRSMSAYGRYIPIGTLEGKIIKCPVHGSQYDVTTGKLVKKCAHCFKGSNWWRFT